MAIIATVSNHAKFQFAKKLIDLSSDSLIAVLMDDTFTFDKDTHATLSLIADHQILTKNGYTQSVKPLESGALNEDDVNDKAVYTCDNITWLATDVDDDQGIGPVGAWCIINTSVPQALELFTTEIDRTFTGGSTHWANVDLSTFDETTDLSLLYSNT